MTYRNPDSDVVTPMQALNAYKNLRMTLDHILTDEQVCILENLFFLRCNMDFIMLMFIRHIEKKLKGFEKIKGKFLIT